MDTLIKDTLTQILTNLELPFSDVVLEKNDEMIRINIQSPNPSRLIGWHGETLNAVQHLLKSIIRSKENLKKAPFIIVDVDDYRKAQEEKVCRTAEQKVDFVRRKKTRVALPPMAPYFRRIVHTFISSHPDYQDITTESVGEGDYRQIVLKLKEGNMDEGEELQPVIAGGREEDASPEEAGDVFGNLDI